MFDGSTLCQQRFVQAYSRLKGLDWHTVRFAFDGQFLRSDLSVAQCDLGHGDIVDALFEQEEERSHANPVIKCACICCGHAHEWPAQCFVSDSLMFNCLQVMGMQAQDNVDQQHMEVFLKFPCGKTATFNVYQSTTVQV